MKKRLSRGPVAVGLAILLAIALCGVVLASLDYIAPTHDCTQTCSAPTPWEVGKVEITNNGDDTAYGKIKCTDDGPEPNSWWANWSAGSGQSVTRGCATQYDLLTIEVYNYSEYVSNDDITHTLTVNQCQAWP